MNKAHYDYLDFLKGLSILWVISLHLPLWNLNFVEMTTWSRVLQYLLRLVAEGVPFFVAINGFLLLGKEKLDLKAHLKKCEKMLFLLIIWAFILAFIGMVLNGQRNEINFFRILDYVLNTQINAPFTGVLWFTQNLLSVYILYPIIWKVYQEDFRLFQYLYIVILVMIAGIQSIFILLDFLRVYYDAHILQGVTAFFARLNPIANGWYVLNFCTGGMLLHYYDKLEKHRRRLFVVSIVMWVMVGMLAFNTSMKTGVLYRQDFFYSSICMTVWVVWVFAEAAHYIDGSGMIQKMLCSVGRNTLGMYFCHFIFIWLVYILFNLDSGIKRCIGFLAVAVCSYLTASIMARIPVLKELVSIKPGFLKK